MCVLILVYLGSDFVGLCRFVLVCGIQLLFMVLCRNRYFCQKGTDTFAEATDLDADIPQEGAACP